MEQKLDPRKRGINRRELIAGSFISAVCLPSWRANCASASPMEEPGSSHRQLMPPEISPRRSETAPTLSLDIVDGIAINGAPSQSDSPAVAELDKILASFVKREGAIGVGYGFASNGLPLAIRCAGKACLKDGSQFEPASFVSLAEVTQLITTVAAMILTDRGVITPDTKIQKILGLSPLPCDSRPHEPRWNNISLEHLLTNRSGIRKPGYPPMDPLIDTGRELWTLNEWGRWVSNSPLFFDPSLGGELSRDGFDIAALTIQTLTGAPFIDVVKDCIFDPLGIKDFEYPESQLPLEDRDRVVSQYAFRAGIPSPTIQHLPPVAECGNASYLLNMSFASLLGFISNFERLVSVEMINRMIDLCYGWDGTFRIGSSSRCFKLGQSEGMRCWVDRGPIAEGQPPDLSCVIYTNTMVNIEQLKDQLTDKMRELMLDGVMIPGKLKWDKFL